MPIIAYGRIQNNIKSAERRGTTGLVRFSAPVQFFSGNWTKHLDSTNLKSCILSFPGIPFHDPFCAGITRRDGVNDQSFDPIRTLVRIFDCKYNLVVFSFVCDIL
jgi:hypothetical protein